MVNIKFDDPTSMNSYDVDASMIQGSLDMSSKFYNNKHKIPIIFKH